MDKDFVHVILAVLLLHDQVGGVLGQGFRHHVRALNAAADQLMTPPLMAEFMRGHEIGKVDVLLSMRPMKPIDSENGTVFGNDWAKPR